MSNASNVFIARFENNKAFLNEEESFHCCKVLRKKTGDAITVIDGKGLYHEAFLESVSEKQCVAVLHGDGRSQLIRNYTLHLAIAPTKQIDRLEWIIEKAVELGIDEMSLLRCHNSERVQVNVQRLRKIIESAVKQSLQARIPELHDISEFSKFIANAKAGNKYIAYCGEGPKVDIGAVDFRDSHSLVLIGPEGDFSGKEVEMAVKSGYSALDLGANRLRTETAGLVVVMAAFLDVR